MYQAQATLDRIEKARGRLILEKKYKYYGVLVSNVEALISGAVETAATNGKQHFWNEKFVAGLTPNQLLGVQVHETEHDARHHGTRRGGRDPEEWNICCDYAINIDLIDEGFELPEGALVDPKYRGWSAEDIFRARELDRKKPEQPKPEQPEQPDEPGENADTDPGDEADDEPDEQDGDEAGDEGQGGQEGQEGQEGGQGAGDEPGDEPGEGAGEGAGEGEGEGEGEGTGEGGDAPGGAGKPGQGTGSGSEAGQPVPNGSSGDPGRCGEVLDSVGDVSVSGDAPSWERVVRQARSIAKAAGSLPGFVTREIERANNPPRDWRDELRDFCEQGALRTETWNRPNRRFVGQGLTLPGSQRDGVNKAAFLIDTSGSCDDIALACVQDEAQQLLDDGIIDEVVVVYGDTRVTRVDEYRTGDELDFDPRGGGGTDMAPLFAHVAEQIDDASLIICFTDLDFYRPLGEEPTVPVLWAVHGYPDRVKAKLANPPWGARAIDVGVH